MAGQRSVFLNGRFLGAPSTAVNTVARQLTGALVALERQDPKVAARYSFTVVVPPSCAEPAAEAGLPHRVIGRREGIAWEQRDLPSMLLEGIVAGFCNTVPLRGRGYVTMLHDAHVFVAKSSYALPVRLWRQMLSRRAGQRGQLVLTVSDYSRQELLSAGVGRPERIKVVPNGVDHLPDSAVEGDIRRRLELTGPYFTSQAVLQPHKNIGLLFKVFARPELAQAKLVLTGRAGREDFEAAGHMVPENVVFPGFVSDADLRSLFAGATASLTPSTTEGFGLPPLEAMLLGTPAVVAPCGALPEVCGDAAIYAAPDDPDAWAAALKRLLDDPCHADALVAAGRARASQMTWDRAARRMVAALDGWSGNRSDL